MKRSKKLDVDDTIEYRRLKGIAKFTLKSTAKEYWHSYCNTIDRSTTLSSVWSMAKKTTGVCTNIRDITLVSKSQQIDTNTDKAELLAKTFSEVSSDANYTHTFLTHKTDIETNHTHLFTHITNTPDKYPELNQPFSFNELYNALQQSRKHSSLGKNRICYEMLKQLPNKCLKVILKLYNQVYLSGQLPVAWKHSIVIGFPKPSKDESLPTS